MKIIKYIIDWDKNVIVISQSRCHQDGAWIQSSLDNKLTIYFHHQTINTDFIIHGLHPASMLDQILTLRGIPLGSTSTHLCLLFEFRLWMVRVILSSLR